MSDIQFHFRIIGIAVIHESHVRLVQIITGRGITHPRDTEIGYSTAQFLGSVVTADKSTPAVVLPLHSAVSYLCNPFHELVIHFGGRLRKRAEGSKGESDHFLFGRSLAAAGGRFGGSAGAPGTAGQSSCCEDEHRA